MAEFGENDKSDKNDKSDEKSPPRMGENSKFKKDVQRGTLERDTFDEHGEYIWRKWRIQPKFAKDLVKLLTSKVSPGVFQNIQITSKEGSL